MKFEDKLIKLRKEKGLSQEELGNEINVSRQAISKWESGQVKPEIEKIKELSNFFNVSTDYLIKEEIEENKSKPKKQKNNKKMLKIILVILAVILILYLITVIYKYIVLAMCVRKINQIENYEEYEIWSINVINDKMLNDVIKVENEIIYKNKVACSKHYTNTKVEKNGDLTYYDYSSNLNNIPEQILYQDFNKGIEYTLSYDYELEKYVYEELSDDEYWDSEDVGKVETIKDIAQYEIGDYFQIIGIAIDPRDKVIINEGQIEIEDKYKDGCINQIIDRYTGFLTDYLWVTDFIAISRQYDYFIDGVEDIEEPDVEYVVLEEREE